MFQFLKDNKLTTKQAKEVSVLLAKVLAKENNEEEARLDSKERLNKFNATASNKPAPDPFAKPSIKIHNYKKSLRISLKVTHYKDTNTEF